MPDSVDGGQPIPNVLPVPQIAFPCPASHCFWTTSASAREEYDLSLPCSRTGELEFRFLFSCLSSTQFLFSLFVSFLLVLVALYDVVPTYLY